MQVKVVAQGGGRTVYEVAALAFLCLARFNLSLDSTFVDIVAALCTVFTAA